MRVDQLQGNYKTRHLVVVTQYKLAAPRKGFYLATFF